MQNLLNIRIILKVGDSWCGLLNLLYCFFFVLNYLILAFLIKWKEELGT